MIWHSRDVNQYRLHTLEQKRLLSIGESEIKCEPRIRFWSEFWFKHHLFKGRTGLPMELKCVDWKPILANLTDLRQITCRDFFNPIATSLKGNRQFSAPLPNALNERLSMDDKDLLERRGSSPARLGKQVSTAVINGDFEVPLFKPMTFSDNDYNHISNEVDTTVIQEVVNTVTSSAQHYYKRNSVPRLLVGGPILTRLGGILATYMIANLLAPIVVMLWYNTICYIKKG